MDGNERDLHAEALDALLSGQVARTVKARVWELVCEVVRLAQQDAPLDLAFADPDLFRRWRESVTRFHLGGWSNMTPERVDWVTGPRRQAGMSADAGGPSRTGT